MQRHRVNRPRVVDETIDGETLIMDMVTGAYYGCDGASAFTWLALAGGASVDETADALVARFGMRDEVARPAVADLLAALVGHELLLDRGQDAPVPLDEAVTAYDGGFAPADGLSVDAFTDLADLILLDPVHDVSEAGWPHKRE